MSKFPSLLVATLLVGACSPPTDKAVDEPAGKAVAEPARQRVDKLVRTEAEPGPDPAFGPSELKAMIEARGADDVIGELFREPLYPRWLAVVAGIGSGDQAWLDTVPLMNDALDGEAVEMVEGALSDALANNPSGALRLAVLRDGIESVCHPGKDGTTATRLAALRALPADDLAAPRDACIRELMQEPAQPSAMP